MSNAVLYARFSPQRDKAKKLITIDAQLDLCRRWCHQCGIDVKSAHKDLGLSGKHGQEHEQRPGLWDAIEDLDAGGILVAYRLDRIARDVYLSYIIEEAVEKKGARIASTCGEGTDNGHPAWKDTAEQKLMRTILRGLNQYNAAIIGERTSAIMRRHQAAGRRMGSTCPYGMTDDPDDPALMVAEPIEQANVRMILRLADQGRSLRDICKWMDGQRRFCRGHVWHPETLRRIVKRGREAQVASAPPDNG